MKSLSFKILSLTVISLCFASCLKDLNREPKYGLSTGTVYSNPSDYINLLAKLYAGFSVSGQNGPAGSPDITGIDEGTSTYLRGYWQLEELTTDEAFWTYDDVDIYQLHYMDWTSSNTFIDAAYDRFLFEVTLCNSFISNCSDANITLHGFSGQTATNIRQYRAEARFLKAISLWHLLDLYGNPPDITNENNFPGSSTPQQITRVNLFNYIQSELLAIEALLPTPGANQQYRADQACVWALLAHLYLNAKVYTGTAQWANAITYCNKIISSGVYNLSPSYRDVFLSDNSSSVAKQEIIFAIEADGAHSQSYGGTDYLCNAPVGGTPWDAIDSFGVTGWNRCLRTTPSFVGQFTPNGFLDTLDTRCMFFRSGQSLTINNTSGISNVAQGYGLAKWRNITSTGIPGQNNTYVDTDYPMFRLGDIYLIYAEAVLNGGGGDMGTALGYINALEKRARPTDYTAIPTLTTQVLINERTREMEWEGSRRMDMIRWGTWTQSSYTWALEGGATDSIGVTQPNYLQLYPIPYNDLVANPNLKQNQGYQ